MSSAFNSQGAIPSYAASNPNYGVLAPKPSGSITAFQSGTQPKIQGTTNFNAPNPNGTPTAAGNTSLQGQAYFQNLVNNGTPLEKQAGQIGLANLKVGTNPGMLPSTPVKKITATDGTVTEFHPPNTSNSSGSLSTAPTPPPGFTPTSGASAAGAGIGSAITPTTQPSATNFQSNLGTTQNSGNQTANEASTQQGLINSGQATPLEQQYIDQVMQAKQMQNAGALGTNADASLYTSNTPEQLYNNTVAAPDLAGRAGADDSLYNTFGNIYGSAATQGLAAANTIAARGEQAAQGAYSGAQTQANRATGANESVQGATAPQYGVQYGTQVGQPGQPNGGIDTSLSGVGTGANVQTIKDNTSKINDIQGQSTAVDNNFSRAINYATSAGLNNNSAILSGLQTTLQGQAGGSASIAGFQQVIGQLNQQATALGFAPVDPTTVTPAQLQQIQTAVKQKLANDVSNLQTQNSSLTSGSSGSTTGGSSVSGFGWNG